MILPFYQLSNYYYELSNISIVCQKPSYRILNVINRRYNGFLYLNKGECYYSSQEGEFILSPGSIAYLPFASNHTLTLISKKLEFFRINFTLKIDGESVLFSKYPVKITDSAPMSVVESILTQEKSALFETNTIAQTEFISSIFRSLLEESANPQVRKLSPAIQYLHAHLTEGIDCCHLADLCALGTTRFYTLFRKEYDCTPLQYRDQLLMKRALLLLDSNDITVSEVSDLLGFDSAAYFSRFFKKHHGITPTEYLHSLI